jgi:Rhodopirellula transposase DDE domain
MDGTHDVRDDLIRRAAKRLRGHQRRLFMAETAQTLCEASPRQAETQFGWGRHTVAKGLRELQSGIRCLENFAARARPRWEEKYPQLAADIRAIVEPYTQADPQLQSARCYTNLSAREVCAALRAQGYAAQDIPKERTMRTILNRMNYRLKRIQKAKPLKKTKDTDAIFANVRAARAQYQDDPTTLQISMDAKAKVAEGEYSRGGKMPNRRAGPDAEGLGS